MAIGPVIEAVDEGGLLVAVLSLDLPQAGWAPVAQLAFFVAVGFAVSWLFTRHGWRGRWWLTAGTVLPVLAWVMWTGLRLSTVVAVVTLAFAGLQLREAAITADRGDPNR